jgi:hypothetical protein
MTKRTMIVSAFACLCWAALAGSCLAGNPFYNSTVLGDGPLHFWTFDETSGPAIDVVSQLTVNQLNPEGEAERINHQLPNSSLLLGRTAAFNGADTSRFYAADLDGNPTPGSSNDPGFDYVTSGIWALELWFEVRGTVDPLAGSRRDYLIEAIGAGNTNRPGIIYDYDWGGGDTNHLEMFSQSGRTAGAGPRITNQGWHHALFVHYGSTGGAGVANRRDIIIDGVQYTDRVSGFASPFALGEFAVGNTAFIGGVNGFEGRIDEVAIYDAGAALAAQGHVIQGHNSAAENALEQWSAGISTRHRAAALNSSVVPVDLIPFGATWRYLDDGSDQGTAWRDFDFDDSGWAAGPAELGYGDRGDEATVVNCGPTRPACTADNFATTYFRYEFELIDVSIVDPSQIVAAGARLVQDDAAVVYLNGAQIYRDSGLPPNHDYSTYATLTTNVEEHTVEFEFDPALFRPGRNVVAVELHQLAHSSSDISFNFQLTAAVIPEPSSLALFVMAAAAFLTTGVLRRGQHRPSRAAINSVAIVFASGWILLAGRHCRADIPPGNVWPNPTVEQIATPGDESTAVPFYWTRLGPAPTGARYSTARSVSATHSLHVTDNSSQFWFWRSDRLNLDTALPGVHFIDVHWHELYNVANANMRFTANLFTNPLATEDEGNTNYDVVGTSSGWASGTFTPRRERLYVPPVRSHLEFQVVSGTTTTGDLHVDDIAVTSSIPAGGIPLVPAGTAWRYHDAATNPGAAWNTLGFNDGGWPIGAAKFGYGDDDESTVINCGTSAPACDGINLPAAFFRRTFSLSNATPFADPTVFLVRDDAAAVYVNGTEVYRDANLPAGAAFNTYATGTAPRDNMVAQFTFNRNLLRTGPNVIAVEVHQASAASSDLSFDLQIQAAPIPEPATKVLFVVAMLGCGTKWFRNRRRRLLRRPSNPRGSWFTFWSALGGVLMAPASTPAQLLHTFSPPGISGFPTDSWRGSYGGELAIDGNNVFISFRHTLSSQIARRGVDRFDVNSGEFIRSYTQPERREAIVGFGPAFGVTNNLLAMQVAEDPNMPAYAGAVAVIDLATGEQRYRLFDPAPLPEPITEGRFGWSIATAGDHIVVGASRIGLFTVDPSAYLFDSANGELLHTFRPGIGPVDIMNDHVIANAELYDAETFERLVEFSFPPGYDCPQFQTAVAMSDDQVFFGCPSANNLQGVAYLFDLHTGALKLTLTDEFLTAGSFGASVAITDQFLVVGAPSDYDLTGQRNGAVYIFDRLSGQRIQTLYTSEPMNSYDFGFSVAAEEDRVAVAQRGVIGKVYLYQVEPIPEPTTCSMALLIGTLILMSARRLKRR